MGFRSALATQAVNAGRAFGRMLGCEVAVEVSEHSIETKMVVPGSDDGKAWDDTMYKHGNLFVKGYANPVKPTVEHREELDESDTVDLEESDAADSDAESLHTKVISSVRYSMFMKNHLAAQLLNPEERLSKIQWALIALGGLQLMMFLVSLAVASAVGVF